MGLVRIMHFVIYLYKSYLMLYRIYICLKNFTTLTYGYLHACSPIRVYMTALLEYIDVLKRAHVTSINPSLRDECKLYCAVPYSIYYSSCPATLVC